MGPARAVERGERSEPDRSRRPRVAAALLSLAAGTTHGIATSAHAEEWWGYGFFFFGAALFQGLYGLLLLGQPWRYDDTGGFVPGRREDVARATFAVGIAVNAALVALYVVTRTVGVPLLGPEAGEVEALDVAGVVAKLLELSLIWCLALLLRGSRRPVRDAATAGDR